MKNIILSLLLLGMMFSAQSMDQQSRIGAELSQLLAQGSEEVVINKIIEMLKIGQLNGDRVMNLNIPEHIKKHIAEENSSVAIAFAKKHLITKTMAKTIAQQLIQSKMFNVSFLSDEINISLLQWHGFRKEDQNGESNKKLLARALFNEYYLSNATVQPRVFGLKTTKVSVPSIISPLNAGWSLEEMVVLWVLRKFEFSMLDQLKKRGSLSKIEISDKINMIREFAQKLAPGLYQNHVKNILDHLLQVSALYSLRE